MIRNPDPKPGRWVLPIVVLGMVLFTWVWVNRLGPPEVDETNPVSTIASTTTAAAEPGETSATDDPVEEETTTTTLVPPEIEVYLNNLSEDKKTLAEVVAEMNATNEEWDNREESGVTYSETEAAMVSVFEQAVVLSAAVELHRPPDDIIPGLAEAHEGVLESANAVATAAENALAGLRAPDTGELRRAALVEFRAAAASFDQRVDQINEITLQGFGR